ncbi:DUF1667 domain-containing protein [Fusibacter ferrireducens]|uniref:DUF1667 domain-containing protein n=1 Tax=Fusibacter ferrireducens TaxID=2785058 RepID=A0ABR9ZQA8_9FIRM|nr:DUF1667 domain-containing protein [Fusibacter ferrireducens]MBF4691819.1 DUF1667 domain-containing protein [Fusibacter ferrireducens]
MEERALICIVCPLGCHLTVTIEDSKMKVFGNKCSRGEAYAKKELTAPTRMLTTTIKIKNAMLDRLPVKTEMPIPKEKIFPCMSILNKVIVEAPVKRGDVVVENILDTGVNIVATRTLRIKIDRQV